MSRRLLTAGASGIVLFVGYAMLPLRGEQRWIGLLLGVALMGLAAVTAVRRLRRLAASDSPIVDALEGVTLVAVLVIVGFASVYYAIAAGSGEFSGIETRIDSLYFTMTTASTVGFGDVVATGQLARSVVILQITVNVVVIGVVVRAFTNLARLRRDELMAPTGDPSDHMPTGGRRP